MGMTNEFAIKVLTELRGYGDKFANIGFDRKEALDMAIKALEQKSYKSEARRWKRRYLDLKQRIFKLEEQTSWIPVKWHIKTEVEEYEQYPEGVVMLDCPMPAEGEDVLITIKGESGQVWVEKDTALKDEDGWYTDGGYEWVDDIIAWMPLPEPYKSESEKDVCKDCYYNDGEVHAECVVCNKTESDKESEE